MPESPTRTDGRRLGMLISHEDTLKELYRILYGSEEGFEHIGREVKATRDFTTRVREALDSNTDVQRVIDPFKNSGEPLSLQSHVGECRHKIGRIILTLNRGVVKEASTENPERNILEVSTGPQSFNYWRLIPDGGGYALEYGCKKANTPSKAINTPLPEITGENVSEYFPQGAYSWVDVRTTGAVAKGQTFNALRTLHINGEPWVSPEGKCLQLEVKHTEKSDGSYDLDDSFSWVDFGM